jgi:hypothetical protein
MLAGKVQATAGQYGLADLETLTDDVVQRG